MLSKLRFFAPQSEQGASVKLAGVDLMPLMRHFGDRLVDLRPVDGGTLGAGYLAQIDGRRRFLKTHAFAQGKEDLNKELHLLRHLYGRSIDIQGVDVDEENGQRLWLGMDQLNYPTVAFNIDQVVEITADLSVRLRAFQTPSVVASRDNMATLLEEGRRALSNLAALGLIGGTIGQRAESCISLLRDEVSRFPPVLCHGDFGPKNLMVSGVSPVAIDWEDAFWGIDGYDYLYWLTFFENRKYYSEDIFGRTQWTKEIEIAILVLIIVLKCELSRRADRHIGNSLTFDERILEILKFQ